MISVPELPKTGVRVRHLTDWPGYAVSETGQVFHLTNGRWDKLTPKRLGSGPNSVALSCGLSSWAARRIDDLVTEAFPDDPLPKKAHGR